MIQWHYIILSYIYFVCGNLMTLFTNYDRIISNFWLILNILNEIGTMGDEHVVSIVSADVGFIRVF